jgi:homoserine/homoserine lactone efflux protein
MIEPHLLLAFVGAVALLMLTPGPNVALIVANSVAYGPRYGLVTMAGTTSAMVPQLLLVGFGLAETMGHLGVWFDWLRWAGVVYLVCIGVRQWRAPVVDLTKTPPERKSLRAIWLRAFTVSLTNPKTLFFFGAFFPQFVKPDGDIGTQMALLSVTFIVIAVLVDAGWALVAHSGRRFLAARGRLRNRISGGLMIGAGAALALTRTR